jgi:nitrate/nitrite-specific signal transduction histidine kinase
MTWAERAADAYAIRHGYGKDLVTGFDKTNKAYRFFGYSKEAVMAMIKAGRFETQLSLMDKLRINAMVPSIARSRLHGLYPSGADRYREIMKVSIQGLKANNANPEFVRRYIEDIEQMIKSIENYDETRGYMAKQEVRYKLMLKYLSVTSWIDIIVHGRVVPEIEQLIGQLDRLSNNLLSFYGEKFNQLARR